MGAAGPKQPKMTTWTRIWRSGSFILMEPQWKGRGLGVPSLDWWDEDNQHHLLPCDVLVQLDRKSGKAVIYTVPAHKDTITHALKAIAKRIGASPVFTGENAFLTSQEWLDADCVRLLKEVGKMVRDYQISAFDGATRTIKLRAKIIKKGAVNYLMTSTVLKSKPIDVIHKQVTKAVKDCQKAWKWKVKDLEVGTFTGSDAMGMALDAGAGNHQISLHRRLFKEYDQHAIYRVVAHELCHHAREELHPRPRYIQKIRGAHDDVFLEMLQQVDPLVTQESVKSLSEMSAEAKKTTKLGPGYMALQLLKTRINLLYYDNQGKQVVKMPFNRKNLQGLMARIKDKKARSVVLLAPKSKYRLEALKNLQGIRTVDRGEGFMQGVHILHLAQYWHNRHPDEGWEEIKI